MKILVIGNGGREHAIIDSIKKSYLAKELFCLPGNGGISKICQIFPEIAVNDHQKIVNLCQQKQIDFVVIGPEQPLIEGLSDLLQQNDIKFFGPSKAASVLEGSKIFTKEICDQYNIPTAKYQKFYQQQDALNGLKNFEMPCVIKADGIAAGKGVIIAQNQDEAKLAVETIFSGKFGAAGESILIEEFLEGKEISVFALCDGKNAIYFGDACDHKKIGEGETGLNTGGMGTYSPSNLVDEKLKKQINDKIIFPTMRAMDVRKIPFTGFLFAGIILTKKGPQLLEFNVRFGDPEAQVILPRLQDDLLELMLKASKGKLYEVEEVKFYNKAAVCVVMAAKGYPEKYQKGTEIKNLDKIEDKNVMIFHAGTVKKDDKILTNGGRVLGLVGMGSDVKKARERSYKAVEMVDWEDVYFRKDIATWHDNHSRI